MLITIPFAGWQGAIALAIIHTIIFYVHERVWLRVGWGKQ